MSYRITPNQRLEIFNHQFQGYTPARTALPPSTGISSRLSSSDHQQIQSLITSLQQLDSLIGLLSLCNTKLQSIDLADIATPLSESLNKITDIETAQSQVNDTIAPLPTIFQTIAQNTPDYSVLNDLLLNTISRLNTEYQATTSLLQEIDSESLAIASVQSQIQTVLNNINNAIGTGATSTNTLWTAIRDLIRSRSNGDVTQVLNAVADGASNTLNVSANANYLILQFYFSVANTTARVVTEHRSVSGTAVANRVITNHQIFSRSFAAPDGRFPADRLVMPTHGITEFAVSVSSIGSGNLSLIAREIL